MKTKLFIHFEKWGETCEESAKITGRHNEGANQFNIAEVAAIIRWRKNNMPTVLKNMRVELVKDEGKINVYEDGETLTYSIQENHYYTLNDALEGREISEDALMENPVFQAQNH